MLGEWFAANACQAKVHIKMLALCITDFNVEKYPQSSLHFE